MILSQRVPDSRSTPRRRTTLRLLTQVLLSAALLAWLGRSVDWAAFSRTAASLPLWFLALSLAVVLGSQALYAWRWWRLLDAVGVEIGLATAIRLYYIGIFANNFLPGTIGGDASKVYALGPRHGYRPVLASIVIDRTMGLTLLAAFAAAAAWAVPLASRPAATTRAAVTVIAVASVAGLGLVLGGMGLLARALRSLGGRAASLADRAQQLSADAAGIVRRPQLLVQGAFVVGTYLLALTALYLGFATLSGIAQPPLVPTFAAIAAIGVLSNVPLSLNGLGVREQLHVWLFLPLGVPPHVALAISLLLFCHVLVASAVGFLWWRLGPPLPRTPVESSAVGAV